MRFDAHVLRSLRENPSMGWEIVVTELIDNAIDQDATEVDMAWAGDRFAIADNGAGVSPEGFLALYTLGGHTRRVERGPTIGRYGIGFKEACGWLWGVTTIKTLHQGRHRRLVIDWDAESRKGLIADEPAVESLPGRPGRPWTAIRCHHVRKLPTLDQFQRIVRQLGHIYRPGLNSGLVISLKRAKDSMHVSPAELPERQPGTPEVRTSIAVAGRLIEIEAYVTSEPPDFAGIHIAAAGRVMDRLPASFTCRNVYGWVTLGPEWEVGKNKTAITDPHRDELYAAVEAACRPVLDAAEHLSRQLVLDQLKADVSDVLSDILQDAVDTDARVVDWNPERQTAPEHHARGRIETPAPGPREGRTPSLPRVHWKRDPDPPTLLRREAAIVNITERPIPTGEMAILETTPEGVSPVQWTVVLDNDHPAVQSYVYERALGALGVHRGMDDTRSTTFAIHVIAAAAAVRDDIAQMLPFLDGYSQDRRYGIAAAHLFRMWLARRGRRLAGDA
jgi:Histidine kinase-, DNA gyrase B-, and HSP90-like ATPase